MPPRKVPMRRGGPLRRSSWPVGSRVSDGERRATLAAQSPKRRRQQQVRRAAADGMAGERCRLQLEPCTGGAEHWHELVGSGVRGSRVDPRNLVPSCDACNSHVEDLPDRYVRRLKVRSTDAIPGRGGLVPAVPHPLALAGTDRWS